MFMSEESSEESSDFDDSDEQMAPPVNQNHNALPQDLYLDFSDDEDEEESK